MCSVTIHLMESINVYITHSKTFNTVDIQINIADMLRKARKRSGYSQIELATMLGTSRSTIVKAEAGEYIPTLKFLEKIAEKLGATLTPPIFNFPEEDTLLTTRPLYASNTSTSEKTETSVQTLSSNYYVGANHD